MLYILRLDTKYNYHESFLYCNKIKNIYWNIVFYRLLIEIHDFTTTFKAILVAIEGEEMVQQTSQ